MLRIVATALLSLLLLPGHSLRAAEPEGVMNFFCSGTAEANDTRRPVKKIGLIINIDERTVIVSGLSVVAHIDRVDDVNILFGMESTAPGDIGRRNERERSLKATVAHPGNPVTSVPDRICQIVA